MGIYELSVQSIKKSGLSRIYRFFLFLTKIKTLINSRQAGFFFMNYTESVAKLILRYYLSVGVDEIS
jgi:hypothetical protein